MQPTEEGVWLHGVQTLLPTPLSTLAQPQCWKDEIPALPKMGNFRGEIPAAVAGTVRQGITFLSVKQNARPNSV